MSSMPSAATDDRDSPSSLGVDPSSSPTGLAPCSKGLAQEGLKSDELAKLWMNENTIVNQKAAYFTAVNIAICAALGSAQSIIGPFHFLLPVAGMLVSLIAFASIARTCAYRAHLRDKLNKFPGYDEALDVKFKIHERISSNFMLTAVPITAVAGWLVVFVLRVWG